MRRRILRMGKPRRRVRSILMKGKGVGARVSKARNLADSPRTYVIDNVYGEEIFGTFH